MGVTVDSTRGLPRLEVAPGDVGIGESEQRPRPQRDVVVAVQQGTTLSSRRHEFQYCMRAHKHPSRKLQPLASVRKIPFKSNDEQNIAEFVSADIDMCHAVSIAIDDSVGTKKINPCSRYGIEALVDSR